MVQAIEPYMCRNGLFPRFVGQVQSAKVIAEASERIYLRDDYKGCPGLDSCITKSYLVSGDRVLIGNAEAGWSCIWYFGKEREYVGWIPSDHLATYDGARIPLIAEWLGKWKPIAGDDSIEISLDSQDGTLFVKGLATWHGGSDFHGNDVVHEGAFEGTAEPNGPRLTVIQGDEKYKYYCKVELQLVSDSLIASDNGICGGVNVRFDNVYRKQ
jgi:hypothetical protein